MRPADKKLMDELTTDFSGLRCPVCRDDAGRGVDRYSTLEPGDVRWQRQYHCRACGALFLTDVEMASDTRVSRTTRIRRLS